jgi:hypothetical protein
MCGLMRGYVLLKEIGCQLMYYRQLTWRRNCSDVASELRLCYPTMIGIEDLQERQGRRPCSPNWDIPLDDVGIWAASLQSPTFFTVT